MDLNLNYDKIVRIESGLVTPGAVGFLSLIPALQFQVQNSLILTKIVAYCNAEIAGTFVNIPIPSFEFRGLGGSGGVGLVQSGVGVNLGIAANLSNKDFGAYSTEQYIEINFPEGKEIDQTGLIRAALFFRFAAVLGATDRLLWNVDWYFKNPQPITVLFEQA